jgi:mono/diheme cytochrome c family protein
MKYRYEILIALMLLGGCDRLNMYTGARLRPYDPSPFFADGRSARLPVPGTVARGHLHDDELLDEGSLDGKEAEVFPFLISRADLDRGRERFNISCSPCHGQSGLGNGMIVQRGFNRPPSLVGKEQRAKPVGHFFRVMTLGLGAMPSYATQVSRRDRWLIAAYIRALQLSQEVPLAELPPAMRAEFHGGGR